MSDPAVFTFLCLFAAHVAGDFVLQTGKMVQNKHRLSGLLSHGAVIAVLTAIALGGQHWVIWAGIMITHIAVDWIKATYLPRTFWAFIADQVIHIAVLALAALMIGTTTVWIPFQTAMTPALIIITGLMLATYTGGPVIGFLMAGLTQTPPTNGINGAGRIIGILERALIFGLALAGKPEAVAFLIAAKSVLRFETAKQSQAISEYVIIGTLASFAWAFAASFATIAALAL